MSSLPQSLLATDGYKFTMAEAGWPLRRETFYYDVDYAYLASHAYEMGGGFKAAIRDTAVAL